MGERRLWSEQKALVRVGVVGAAGFEPAASSSFLVDVDGVLVHEEHAIPGTNRSIQALRLPTSRSWCSRTTRSTPRGTWLCGRAEPGSSCRPRRSGPRPSPAQFLDGQRPGGSAFAILAVAVVSRRSLGTGAGRGRPLRPHVPCASSHSERAPAARSARSGSRISVTVSPSPTSGQAQTSVSRPCTGRGAAQ